MIRSILNLLSKLNSYSWSKTSHYKARKSVASFKIREGWPLGCKVTLEATKCMNLLKG